MTDLIILAILTAGPVHGYALKKRAGLVLGQPELHNNIIYPMLNRFIEQGWVKRKEANGERGQTRQVYSITAAGRAALVEKLSEFGEKQAYSEKEFHVRVGLFELLPPDARNRILAARRGVLERREAHLALLQESEKLGGFNAEVVGFTRRQVQSEMEWIRKLSRMRART
jgi:DNA-binding PadR family transcriptional regulator